MTKKFTAISLFSGAGGMDVGFTKAGFEILWANDINEDACETYKANHNQNIRCGDIDRFINELDEFRDEQIDVVFGGPPCQGFSVAGKMDPNDERSQLVFKFMEAVKRVRPKIFVMENVKALGILEKWESVRKILFKKAFELGYEFTELKILNATEYGVPQKRERMFLIGINDSIRINELDGIEKYINKYKKVSPTVGELLRELGIAGSKTNNQICNAKITLAKNPVLRRSPYAGMLFNGAGRPINPKGYSNTLPASMGGNKTPIIDENQIYNDGGSWVEQYHEQLINGANPGHCEVPKFLRRLTVDEALRIQTFPNDYIFKGNRNSIYTQIGNAVPCNLASAVAKGMFDILLKHSSVENNFRNEYLEKSIDQLTRATV